MSVYTANDTACHVHSCRYDKPCHSVRKLPDLWKVQIKISYYSLAIHTLTFENNTWRAWLKMGKKDYATILYSQWTKRFHVVQYSHASSCKLYIGLATIQYLITVQESENFNIIFISQLHAVSFLKDTCKKCL